MPLGLLFVLVAFDPLFGSLAVFCFYLLFLFFPVYLVLSVVIFGSLFVLAVICLFCLYLLFVLLLLFSFFMFWLILLLFRILLLLPRIPAFFLCLMIGFIAAVHLLLYRSHINKSINKDNMCLYAKCIATCIYTFICSSLYKYTVNVFVTHFSLFPNIFPTIRLFKM